MQSQISEPRVRCREDCPNLRKRNAGVEEIEERELGGRGISAVVEAVGNVSAFRVVLKGDQMGTDRTAELERSGLLPAEGLAGRESEGQ